MKQYIFDIEANGLDDATVAWCISVLHAGKDERWFYGPDQISEGLNRLIEADELIGHGIVEYDLPLLKRLYGFEPKNTTKITDTLILSRLYKSDRDRVVGSSTGPHSLESWAIRIGSNVLKVEHEDWSQYSPEMMGRCDTDVEITEMVWVALKEEAASTGLQWEEAEILEHDVAKEIVEQQRNGIPLNLGKIEDLLTNIRVLIDGIDSTIGPLLPEVALPDSKQPSWPSKQFKKDGTPTQAALKYYGEDFSSFRTDRIIRTERLNLASPKQVKDYLVTLGWIPTEWNYKMGLDGKPIRLNGEKIKTSPKLTLDSVESITWPDGYSGAGAMIVDRMMLSHRQGILLGFQRDVRPDGFISAEAIAMGTPTGRMVQRKVVNLPGVDKPYGYEIRDCFGTIPGYTRIGMDLDSCQLRGLANTLRDPLFRSSLLTGDKEDKTDVYSLTYLMVGLKDRQEGKKFVYSIIFGASDEKLSVDLGITVAQAAAARRLFFAGIPTMGVVMTSMEKEWKKKGYITGLDGRAIWVRAKHMLLVYLLQTIESVTIKNFIVQLNTACRVAGIDFKLVTTMHDEVQYLVKHENVDEFIDLAYNTMNQINEHFTFYCPQALDIKKGATWADCH
jgi:hypothetical protein